MQEKMIALARALRVVRMTAQWPAKARPVAVALARMKLEVARTWQVTCAWPLAEPAEAEAKETPDVQLGGFVESLDRQEPGAERDDGVVAHLQGPKNTRQPLRLLHSDYCDADGIWMEDHRSLLQ